MQIERMTAGTQQKKTNRLLIAVVLAIIAGLVFKFGFKTKGEQDSLEVVEKTAAYVETITLGEAASDIAKLERTAIFRSSQTGEVVAENTGRIRQVNFEIGDLVRQGQILAVFDQSSTESTAKTALDSAQLGLALALDSEKKTKKAAQESLELAKNARKIAKLQYENAKDDPEQDEKIAKRTYENSKDLEEQAEQNVKIQKNQAQLQVNQAQSALDGARVAFEKTILRAPISGKVVSKNVAVDDYIVAGSRIAGVVGEGRLEATVSLNADQISRVKMGDQVTVELAKKTYPGKIVSLSAIAKTTNQRFDVKVMVDQELTANANQTGKVIFSLALDGELRKTAEQETFFAPISAVNLGQTKSVVFVLEDGRAQIREVQLGEVIGEKIEITTGVSAGEKLIVVNSRNLQDGQVVTTEKSK